MLALSRRINYLRELLVNAKAEPPAEVVEAYGLNEYFDDNLKAEMIFSFFRDENVSIKIFNNLLPNEHLRYKFLSTFKQFLSNKTISRRLENSEVDVSRQLKRIYFLRNKIAHTGHYSNIRPQLITHLLDYIASCYISISASAETATELNNYSIDELFSAFKMGSDVVKNKIDSKVEVSSFEQLKPNPII